MFPRDLVHCVYIFNLYNNIYSIIFRINWWKIVSFKKWSKPVCNKPKYILRQYRRYSTLKYRLGALVHCNVDVLWKYLSSKCSVLQMFKISKLSAEVIRRSSRGSKSVDKVQSTRLHWCRCTESVRWTCQPSHTGLLHPATLLTAVGLCVTARETGRGRKTMVKDSVG